MNVIDALAIYRLTRLITKDSFPPIADVRDSFVIKMEQNDEAEHWSVELLSCAWCLSFWIGIGAMTMKWFSPRLWNLIAKPLAVSAVVGILSDIETRIELEKQ